MRFFDFDESAQAPEFFMRGIGAVETIGASTIRMTLVTWTPNDPVPRAVAYVIGDRAELMEAAASFHQKVLESQVIDRAAPTRTNEELPN